MFCPSVCAGYTHGVEMIQTVSSVALGTHTEIKQHSHYENLPMQLCYCKPKLWGIYFTDMSFVMVTIDSVKVKVQGSSDKKCMIINNGKYSSLQEHTA